MKRKNAALCLLAMMATTAESTPGGRLDTLPLGLYVCENPGDATGPTGLRVPDQDFTIINSSSYATGPGNGTYLLTGDTVVMTAGPLKGKTYRRKSNGFVRLMADDGSETRLRCILTVDNNRR